MLKKVIIFILLTISLYATTATKENVTKLYVATFNRAPDSAGLDYWVNDSGLSLANIAQSFFDQPEAKEKYPDGSTNGTFIDAIYYNLFNRASDTDGFNYWKAELDAGTIEKSVFILAVVNGAQDEDADILTNKTDVGLSFAEAGLDDATIAKDIMASVTHDTATITSALDSFSVTLSSIAKFKKPFSCPEGQTLYKNYMGFGSDECFDTPIKEEKPEDDHGSSISDATTISLNTTTSGKLEEYGNKDYFKFTVLEKGTITINTTGDSVNIFIFQYNSTTTSIDSDYSSDSGDSVKIIKDVTAGTYYIKVRGYAGNTGNYSLVLSFTSSLIPADVEELFTRSNDTIKDNKTNLIWQDDTAVITVVKPWTTQANYDAGKYNDTSGDTAATYCSELALENYTDWRLPTFTEIEILVDKNNLPTINSIFINTLSDNYWTSTTYTDDASGAWAMNFNDATFYAYAKSGATYVMCVSDGKKITGNTSVPENDATIDSNISIVENDDTTYSDTSTSVIYIHSNNTVSDNAQLLMWQDDLDAASVRKPWLAPENSTDYYNTKGNSAATYCSNLTLDSFTDWRLPSKEELLSIVDEDNSPTINKIFKNKVADTYWSRETYYNLAGAVHRSARYVDFARGIAGVDLKSDEHYIRCIRKLEKPPAPTHDDDLNAFLLPMAGVSIGFKERCTGNFKISRDRWAWQTKDFSIGGCGGYDVIDYQVTINTHANNGIDSDSADQYEDNKFDYYEIYKANSLSDTNPSLVATVNYDDKTQYENKYTAKIDDSIVSQMGIIDYKNYIGRYEYVMEKHLNVEKYPYYFLARACTKDKRCGDLSISSIDGNLVTNHKAVGNDTHIQLEWEYTDNSKDAVTFNVYRSKYDDTRLYWKGIDRKIKIASNITDTWYNDYTVKEDIFYYYWVSACYSGGGCTQQYSLTSGIDSRVWIGIKPGTIESPILSKEEIDGRSGVKLSWDSVPDADYYEITEDIWFASDGYKYSAGVYKEVKKYKVTSTSYITHGSYRSTSGSVKFTVQAFQTDPYKYSNKSNKITISYGGSSTSTSTGSSTSTSTSVAIPKATTWVGAKIASKGSSYASKIVDIATISWSTVADASYYQVYRSQTPLYPETVRTSKDVKTPYEENLPTSLKYNSINSLNTYEYVNPKKYYWYWVRACNWKDQCGSWKSDKLEGYFE